jgi:hypothetical protein
VMNFKKTLVAMAAGLIVLPPLSAADARKMTGSDLSQLIIQGENRLNYGARAQQVAWEPSVYREMQDMWKDYSQLAQFQPPAIEKPPVKYPARLNSWKTASPWLERIYAPPLLTLVFKESKVQKQKWAFLVKDSQGKTFYEQKKTGALPKNIAWSGTGSGGEPLRVGYDYSYSFSAMDEAGNPQRHSGQSFRVESFETAKSGRRQIGFQPEALFENPTSLKLSNDGRAFLTEVKDKLRPSYGFSVDVAVYEEDVKFATGRAMVVRDFLRKSLDWPEDKVTAQGLSLKEGKGYRHVDIHLAK